ncbi:MAG TPA: YlmC/YmxH family sporulation protein [Candidatus Avamphibacillus intestinigallinarum]|nr:YlmC/YmxH family sporulation protein [Candidatus Avamphibacillus intestinigallinarum]
MRYKEIGGKEIIDIRYGKRYGMLSQTDLEIDPHTGEIASLIIPSYKWFGFKKDEEETKILWSEIETIGTDMILINNEES